MPKAIFFVKCKMYWVACLHPKNNKIDSPAEKAPAPSIATPMVALPRIEDAKTANIPLSEHNAAETSIAHKETIHDHTTT